LRLGGVGAFGPLYTIPFSPVSLEIPDTCMIVSTIIGCRLGVSSVVRGAVFDERVRL